MMSAAADVSSNFALDAAIGLLKARLRDPANTWAIGALGALAEFARDADEDAELTETERGGSAITARGAIIAEAPDGAAVVAYEGLSGHADRWTHGVAFHLPDEAAAMSRRTVLTELDRDEDAARPEDRSGVLFDTGLGAANVDVCVRTADPDLLTALRREAGRRLLADGSAAMAAIKATSPHRVFRSRMGRVEVYQRIGSSARNIPTPEGPHTHVLPGLLKAGRTHSANIPIPAGHMPALLLYPPSPVSDAMGDGKPFDRGDFDAFQGLLDGFGPRGYVAEKRRITEAVLGDVDAGAYRPARSRMGRTGARIALRQMVHTHGAPQQLWAWRNVYDRVSEAPDPHGH